MSITMKRPAFLGVFVLIFGLGIIGCDSAGTGDAADGDFASLEVQDLYNAVTSEVDMTAGQAGRFARALSRHDHRDRQPGFLWIVADSLANTLTDEQKDALLARTAPLEGGGVFRGLAGFPGGGPFYGLGGFKGASRRHGESPIDEALDLTDEQVDAIHEIHEAFRAEVKALRELLNSGEITQDDFLRAMIDLHAGLKDAVGDVLTDEQKAALEDFKAQREANFLEFRAEVIAVRDEVLGLTESESESFNTILEDHLEAREVLLEQFLEGEIDRSTLESEIDALNDVRIAALQALLTEAQYEVVQIHDALAVRMGRRGHQHGPLGGR